MRVNHHSSSGTIQLATLGKKPALSSLTSQMSNIPLNLPPVRNGHLIHRCSMEAKLGCPGPPPRPRIGTLSSWQRPPQQLHAVNTLPEHLLCCLAVPGSRSENHTLVEGREPEQGLCEFKSTTGGRREDAAPGGCGKQQEQPHTQPGQQRSAPAQKHGGY